MDRHDAPLPLLRLRPPGDVGATRAFADFGGLRGVAYVEPAYAVSRLDAPADPLWTKEAPYLTVERAPEAWDIEKGNPSVVVAVVDSGIDLTHPDLQGRIWSNLREVPGNGVDDDGNGCIDDVHGCAFVGEPPPGCGRTVDGNVTDEFGHGTFVSGIIAANANAQGIVGVARNATILPVKVLDCHGGGDTLMVSQGILYAAQAGARIINISLGGPIDSQFVREAVETAQNRYGALIVAASGNSAQEGITYPARYAGVLAVGATESDDPTKRATFSTWGPEIGVVAIGRHILGTVPPALCTKFLPCLPGGPYAAADGTSFAAPQVAGLAALILAHHPTARAGGLIRAIESTAVPLASAPPLQWAGSGRIDMFAALNAQTSFRLGVPGTAKN